MSAVNEAGGGMEESSHFGRASSWFAVGIMLAGFILGGVALVVGPSWPLFWAGVAVAAVGGFLALAVGIFSDVIVYTPVDISAGSGRASAEAANTTTPDDTPGAASPAPRTGAENLASS